MTVVFNFVHNQSTKLKTVNTFKPTQLQLRVVAQLAMIRNNASQIFFQFDTKINDLISFLLQNTDMEPSQTVDQDCGIK